MKANKLKIIQNFIFYTLASLFAVFYIRNTSIDFRRVYNEHIVSVLLKELLKPLIFKIKEML